MAVTIGLQQANGWAHKATPVSPYCFQRVRRWIQCPLTRIIHRLSPLRQTVNSPGEATAFFMKTVYLIRHAQSHLNPGVSYEDWPLSEQGRLQALRLASFLNALKIEEVYCSPYLRCRQTIDPFLQARGLSMTLINDLREHLITREIREDFFEIWKKSWDDFDFVVDGGESSRQCQQRIVPAITEIVRNSDASEFAIVSHGNAIGLFLNFLVSDFGYTNAEQIRNPDIFQIEFKDDSFHWKREFSPDPLDQFASGFRETPIDE